MVLKITEPISHITETTGREFNVFQINSIQHRYKEERNESKAPTFAFT